MAALDVTSADSITACMAEITAAAGAVHVLINNAGAQSLSRSHLCRRRRCVVHPASLCLEQIQPHAGMQATAPLIEQPLEHFTRVLDTNCTGAVRMMQAAAPAMVRQVSVCPSCLSLATLWPACGHASCLP